jgi:hypothetical protein
MSFRQRLSHIKNAYRPGHYYSPICDPRELKLQPFNAPIEGVDLNHDGQLERWQRWQSQNNSEFEWSLYSPNNSFLCARRRDLPCQLFARTEIKAIHRNR